MVIQDFNHLREPIKKIVIDFNEAMKRIKKVKFWPDQVVIELIADHEAVRTSVLILNIRVIGENRKFPYVSKGICLTEEYKQDSIYYDKARQAIIIPIAGVKSLIFFDKEHTKTFSKK